MNKQQVAMITGASGQDAYYLSKILLSKNYHVVAIQRRSARPSASTVNELTSYSDYTLTEGDITDLSSVVRIINQYNPDEFYHLAAQSEVGTSFNQPLTTIDITGMGTANCLEAVRLCKLNTKFYFAGSSEQFGDTHGDKFLNESSIMYPRSPYAAAKIMGYHLARLYRESYNMFVCCGILFNHESPHRKEYFVTRKITKYVAGLQKGLIDTTLRLGNVNSGRDWGHSLDYMKAAWMMLQHDKPDDYVVATGQFHTIKDLLTVAFAEVGIINWSPYVKYSTSENMRPHDVIRLLGDSSKIRRELGWKPQYSFEGLIKEMVQHDLL